MSYKLNHIREKKFEEGHIITTDLGTWVYLKEDEYKSFKFKDFSKEDDLFKKLEDAFIIITEKNTSLITQRHNDYYWYLGTGTSLHIIIPTLRCNHTCVYCYAYRQHEDSKGYDMTEELAKKTVDRIFESPAPVLSIEFSGGEPLIRFDIVKYTIEYIKQKNKNHNKKIVFSIVTNGTLLTDEIIDYFKENRVGLCFSLDGPKEVHDNNRKFLNGSGTYDTVVSKIKQARKRGYEKGLHSIPVITKKSLSHWKETIDLLIELDFDVIRYKYLSFFGFATESWKQIGYTPDEFLKTYEKVVDYILELNKKGIKFKENLGDYMILKLLYGKNAGFAEMQVPCGAVIGQLVYNYNGDVYTCDEGRNFEEFKIGNVMENTYKEILSHPTSCSMINVSSNLSFSCDNCYLFSFCGRCPLEDYTKTGSVVANVPCSQRCQIYKGMFEIYLKRILDPEKKKLLEGWQNHSLSINWVENSFK